MPMADPAPSQIAHAPTTRSASSSKDNLDGPATATNRSAGHWRIHNCQASACRVLILQQTRSLIPVQRQIGHYEVSTEDHIGRPWRASPPGLAICDIFAFINRKLPPIYNQILVIRT